MIKTKCHYYPKDISDGERILITRYWPRGIKKNISIDGIKNYLPQEIC